MKPNTSLMRHAMVHIDAAINALAMIHNKGIEQGATDKLKRIYDWLGATAQVLDDMAKIERTGDQDG
jgi:hypothetical protein